MVNIEYARAYKEVFEILKYIPEEDYNKIPNEKIELYKTMLDKDYDFKYDSSKTLDEQNVTKRAKAIIGLLFRDYWATDTQREKILAKQKYERQKIEEDKVLNYKYEDLFKKNKTEIKQAEIKDDIENVSLVEYKESIFTKFFNKIKSIF